MDALFSLLALVLVAAAVLLNGATDAPNAIAGAVATGAIGFRAAATLAAACNLAGILLVGLTNASVAASVMSFSAFGANREHALAAICAVMLAVAGFAAAAWRLGIPTSESHALVAALAGATPALGGPAFQGAWGKVLGGLVVSLLLGFLAGCVISAGCARLLARLPHRWLDRWQIASSAAMSFMHGAQDGQKFAALFVLTEWYASGTAPKSQILLANHLPLLVLCALLMALGTSLGGKRIVQNVGENLVRLEKQHAVCADLAGAACLLLASLCGMPVSTTHTKTAAMAGSAAAAARSRLDCSVLMPMLLAWAVTFPVCGAAGYGLTKIFVMLL